MTNTISIDMELKIKTGQQLLQMIHQEQYEAYFVGGFVRDMLLCRFSTLDDIDIATNMPISLLKERFDVIYQAEAFGMLCVMYENYQFEVTQFRKDGIYLDGRRPETISCTQTLIEDVKRRDFTINGIAMDDKMQVIDYVDGVSDIKHKCLRTIGDASLRFQEDSLRIIRALRFASNLNFRIEDATCNAIFENRTRLSALPLERIHLEVEKTTVFKQFLFYIRKFELHQYHEAFEGVNHIPIVYDDIIHDWESLVFFQLYMSDNRERIYKNLHLGKQKRRLYEKIICEVHTFNQFGQTAWWNYQLQGETAVFKFLALLYETPYNEYVEIYEQQQVKIWRDIQFNIEQLHCVPKEKLSFVKETIAHDVIHHCVENKNDKILTYIEEVYGWK